MAVKAEQRSTRFLVLDLPGAKEGPFPTFVNPCLAVLAEAPPEGATWLYEIKHDGYRVQAHVSGGRARLYTRRGHDWTERFGSLAKDVGSLPVTNAVIDGEVVGIDQRGRPDYAALQADLARGRGGRLAYYMFDLLYIDGLDVRRAPLRERKRVLQRVQEEAAGSRLLFSQHLQGNGAEIFANACSMGLEGIVCKDREALGTVGELAQGQVWTIG